MLVGEADRAVKLDAGLGNEHCILRCLGLHGDGQRGIDTIGIVIGGDLIQQRPRRLGPDIDVDRLMLQRLKAADRLTELLADSQIVEA